MTKELKWTQRWKRLRKAGLSEEQLMVLFKELSYMKAFRFYWLERSAFVQLQEVLRAEREKEVEK